MTKQKDRIYMEQWLEFHPYASPGQYDYYYLKLCNEMHGILKKHRFPEYEYLLSGEDGKRLMLDNIDFVSRFLKTKHYYTH